MSPIARDPRQVLGVEPDAGPVEVESHYRELQSFLDLRVAPGRLRPWVIRQRALADEAYAALASQSDGDPAGSLWNGEEPAATWEDDESAGDPDAPHEPPVTEPQSQISRGRIPAQNGLEHTTASGYSPGAEGLLELVTEGQNRSGRSAQRDWPPSSVPSNPNQVRAAARGSARAQPNQPRSRHKGLSPDREILTAEARPNALPRLTQVWQRVAIGVILGLVALGILYVGIKGFPGISANSAQSSAPSAGSRQQQALLDNQRVAELKAIVEKDPSNKDALFELGELYIEAGKWQESLDWLKKFLEFEPDNLEAMRDVGTDLYNLGRTAEAKEAWEEVARRDPNDPQIHYNLGFFYANAPGKERNIDAARREWQKVIESAPNTELAKHAQSGLDELPRAAGQ